MIQLETSLQDVTEKYNDNKSSTNIMKGRLQELETQVYIIISIIIIYLYIELECQLYETTK